MTELSLPSPLPPPVHPSRPPDELRRVVAMILVVVAVVLALGTGGFLIHTRNLSFDAATTNTEGVARLLDEHLNRTLSTTDMFLRRMALAVQSHHHGRITSEQELIELGNLQSSLPEQGSIIVLDAAGNTAAAILPHASTMSVNLADRPWFQAHAAGTDLTIGPMVRTRYSNTLVFTISRRVTDDDGRFIGVVACGIQVAYFTDFYNSLVLGRGGFISASTDGELLLRQPDAEKYLGQTLAGGQIVAAARHRQAGTEITTSSLDGVNRITSFRRLANYDVLVTAGMDIDDVLAPWTLTAWTILAALTLIGLTLAALAAMAFRGIRREQQLLAGLEKMVLDRTEEAENRAEDARRANESKTRFLATASHDLRQPLQAAGMFAEVLAARITDPATVTVVDKLRRSIEATNSLLGTLLDVSALEAGKITPNISTFRVMPLLAGLVDQIEPEATARGLSIGAVPTEAKVVSDPVLLERLLRNLVINAVRNTETGGVLIGCRHRGADLAIQVWDTGIGIPPSQVAKIFDDFTRIERPGTKADTRGLGLGLGVVRRMATLLDHRLEVHTLNGRGSCFGVVVPRG